ncbi:MAG: hypothetical protein IJ737_02515 [Ruminococcus sp.]|nr:hypothetical protein [Ruminococcus sp.]
MRGGQDKNDCGRLLGELRSQIREILDSLGTGLSGRALDILTESAVCAAVYPRHGIYFGATLIPFVMEQCGCSEKEVEESLRDAADTVWDRCSSRQRQTYFGFGETSPFAPHSSDLILELADIIYDRNRLRIRAVAEQAALIMSTEIFDHYDTQVVRELLLSLEDLVLPGAPEFHVELPITGLTLSYEADIAGADEEEG